jgi:type IV pilus assembly protein PilV
MQTRRISAGFTMLEVLISIVILAFGLLGVAGLQAFALKNNQSASFRLTATMLAEDLADRIRANQPAMMTAEYDSPSSGSYSAGTNCEVVGECTTPQQVAEFDRAQWQRRIQAALPGGSGIVCVDSTPDDGVNAAAPACDGAGDVAYAIKIWWNDDRVARTAPVAPQRFVTIFHP